MILDDLTRRGLPWAIAYATHKQQYACHNVGNHPFLLILTYPKRHGCLRFLCVLWISQDQEKWMIAYIVTGILLFYGWHKQCPGANHGG